MNVFVESEEIGVTLLNRFGIVVVQLVVIIIAGTNWYEYDVLFEEVSHCIQC